jgi:hypothetical protein
MKEKIDNIWKTMLIIISIAYALGFLIVNIHLGSNGIYSIELFKNTYILAGVWFLIYLIEDILVVKIMISKKKIKKETQKIKIKIYKGYEHKKFRYSGLKGLRTESHIFKLIKNLKKFSIKIEMKEFFKGLIYSLIVSFSFSIIITYLVALTSKNHEETQAFTNWRNNMSYVYFFDKYNDNPYRNNKFKIK